MKKLILFILMLIAVITLVGCTNGEPKDHPLEINGNLVDQITEEIKGVFED